MVATAQSDPYRSLSHKIGWSVGLEKTFDRVRRLVERYVEEGNLTYGMWVELYKGEWNLTNDHITDFFGAIDLIAASGRTLYVLPTLDALAVLWKQLPGEERDDALRYVLAVRFVLDDGDIFLNCLAAEFEPEAGRALLVKMGTCKIEKLKKVFPNSAVQAKVFKLVKVDTQPTNRGSKGASSDGLMSRRIEELTRRTTSLSAVPSDEITVSDDYLRKVLGRRRDWAIALGLAKQSGSITDLGQAFLAQLRQSGFQAENGSYVVWPLRFQFTRLAIKPEDLGAPDLTVWSFLQEIFLALGGDVCQVPAQEHVDEAVDFLAGCFREYRVINKSTAILKNELPTYVGYAVYLASCFAKRKQAHRLPELIELDRTGPARRILLRPSQNSDGSLTIRKKDASVFLS